jgi:hypothetical protein
VDAKRESHRGFRRPSACELIAEFSDAVLDPANMKTSTSPQGEAMTLVHKGRAMLRACYHE